MPLDFVEAKDDWKRQWALCETAALFYMSDGTEDMLWYVYTCSLESFLTNKPLGSMTQMV